MQARARGLASTLAFLLLLCVLWLSQLSDPAGATETIQETTARSATLRVTPHQELYQLGNYLDILEDPSGELGIADIRSPAVSLRFRPSGLPVPNLGFTDAVVWARLELTNDLAEEATYHLLIDYPLLDRITLFIDGQQGLSRHDTGDRTPFATRLLDTRMFVFPLSLEPGETLSLSLRFATESAMNLPMLLLSQRQLIKRITTEYSVLSLYYGILLMLIVYNLYHYLRLRDINALHYVFFIGNYIAFQLALNGISFQYLWPNSIWWANANLPFFICSTCFAGTLFTRSILNTERYTPHIHRLLGALRWIAAAGAALALFGPYAWAIKYAVGLVFALVIFVVAGIRISLMGFRPARYYTLAWAVSLTGMIVYSLKTYGVLPTNLLTTWSTQIGSAWDAIILAFAISDRFYLIEDEKRQVQATARAELAASNDKLNQLNEELESRVATGLEELRVSNTELRAEADIRRTAERKADAANRAKSEFLANMSHEIRTPMNAVVGFAHLLSRTGLGRDQRDYVEKIDQASGALLAIIKDILDFSRIEAGRLDLELAPFSPEELLGKARGLVELSAARKNLTLEFRNDCPPESRLIGDEGRLLQILMNLLSNGVKFTESGRVCLHLRCEPEGANQIRLRFSVEDTGIGIPRDQRTRLFRPFTQADASITRRFGGTGLGLAISQRLVNKMGGRIEVSSKVGAGSRFQFDLRFERAADDALPPDRDVGNGDLFGMRILLVEDQPLNQEIAVGILRSANAEVEVAENGAEALRRLRADGANAYNAVLMDVQMPILDGYETTRRIRNELGFHDLPIIAMTAHALADERERCRDAGMDDYIAKPIDVGGLFRTLGRWRQAPRIAKPPSSSAGSDSAPNAPLALPDRLPGIELSSGLERVGNDAAFYRRLLLDFYDYHKGYAERIEALIADGDRDGACRTAHALAGIALNLGVDDLGNHARSIEQSIEMERDGLEAQLTALTTSMVTLGESIARLRQGDFG
ncbi:MAG: 7TM diverse intracellular signaling domain-containing protein [Thiohalocapsa sp.]